MPRTLPEPGPRTDLKAMFLDYLDFYRETIADKVMGLSPAQLRSSNLPSGWSAIELVKHLVFMERRWLVWGFAAEEVPDPWGDQRDGRWQVGAEERLAELLAALRSGGSRTRRVVESAGLSTPAATGGRFAAGSPTPSLTAILFHVLQEYARHAGHLDIARELADGSVGE
jgi:uncharacterized damage-inducible protein DinB